MPKAETIINNGDFVSCREMSVDEILVESIDTIRRRNHMMKQLPPDINREHSIRENAIVIVDMFTKELEIPGTLKPYLVKKGKK